VIVNWYRRETRDPWWTGGAKPPVPSRCGASPTPPSGTWGNLNPPPTPDTPPNVAPEACNAGAPGPATCTLDAKAMGGVSGYGAAPGGWTATIRRPGLNEPIVIKSFGGYDLYACGSVLPGDRVEVATKPGSTASAAIPGRASEQTGQNSSWE